MYANVCSERSRWPSCDDGDAMTGEDTTAAAMELAERILDEVSRLDQDWRTIASLSRELGAVADAAAVSSEESKRSRDDDL